MTGARTYIRINWWFQTHSHVPLLGSKFLSFGLECRLLRQELGSFLSAIARAYPLRISQEIVWVDFNQSMTCLGYWSKPSTPTIRKIILNMKKRSPKAILGYPRLGSAGLPSPAVTGCRQQLPTPARLVQLHAGGPVRMRGHHTGGNPSESGKVAFPKKDEAFQKGFLFFFLNQTLHFEWSVYSFLCSTFFVS